MNAQDVKDALYQRHPAVIRQGGYVGTGPWTVLEEWDGIDLLAWLVWTSLKGFPANARIGYEVKVSRSDYRRELRQPFKREGAVRFCHQFYFAVPKGLLKPEEIAFDEPKEFRDPVAFKRTDCPDFCYDGKVYPRDEADKIIYSAERVKCATCGGRGYLEKSLVERTAPTLWVPVDVGLVEIDTAGRVHVAKKAPTQKPATINEKVSDHQLAALVRFASIRPDPRHAELRGAAA